jgi:translocation and assembly module TamA
MRALLAALPWLLVGCSALQGPKSEPGPAASLGRPALAVDIVAPPELKELLERHLDVTRLPALSRGDAVSESEWSRLIDAAPAQVAELLQTEGYFAPTITPHRQPAPSPDAPQRVRIEVVPGPRAVVTRVTLEVEGPLQAAADAGDALARRTLDEWRTAWALPRGSVFRNSVWSEVKATALARMRAAGYAAANWSGTAAEVNRERHELRLFLVLDSGPLFKAGDIDIEGLVAQDAATVRNLALFDRGAPLTEALLIDFQERLQKSGLYESVTVTHDLDPGHAQAARVSVKLREQPLQVYTAAVGYSANTGQRASIEHVHRRLFGYPLRSRSFVEYGRLRQALELEVSTHPGPGLYRKVVGVTLERLKTSNDVVRSQRLRLGRARDTQAFELLVFAEAENSLRTTDTSRSETFALSGNAHAVLRRLDSVVLPTQGYTLALQGGIGRSHGTGAPSGLFSRSYARFTGYWPLGQSWYGQGRVELGQVFRKTGVVAPDSQLFRAGGDDSVRGYAFRQLGPTDSAGAVTGGAALLTASVEVARPFTTRMPSLWGALFADAGRAAASFGELKPAVGIGAGLRWRSPVGPLRLDLAWGNETKKVRLHFSIGIAL